jgi:hypothetical protein
MAKRSTIDRRGLKLAGARSPTTEESDVAGGGRTGRRSRLAGGDRPRRRSRDTLAHWRRTTGYGRAIAAPQIGIRKRVVFLNLGEPWPMINPAIVERSEETMVLWDACLSFLFVFCQVVRHRELTVRYQDLEGVWHELEAGVENDLSALFQLKLQYTETT